MEDGPEVQNENDPAPADQGWSLPRGAAAAILRSLALGEHTVGELVSETGLAQPNVSNHLARLRAQRMVECRRDGRRVIYRLGSAALGRLVLAQGAAVAQGTPRLSPAAVAEQFVAAVLTMREEDATRVVDTAMAAGLGWKELYLRVFAPALVQVGDMWEREELSVADEHLITAIVHRLLHRLSLSLPVAPHTDAPTAVVACVEGELHTLGGRMVADFLLAQGWRVWYLNGSLPLEDLLDAVNRHLPDGVVLCISAVEHADSLARTVERLHRWRGEQPLPLIVAGGRYFATAPAAPDLDVSGTDIEQVSNEMARRIQAVKSRSSLRPS